MRKSFKLPSEWFSVRNRGSAVRAVLGVLLGANIIASILAFFPPGGSLESLESELAQARSNLIQTRRTAENLKNNLAKVTKAREQAGTFMQARFLERRTAYSALEVALAEAAKTAGIQPKDRTYGYEPVEGSADLGIAIINANFEGTYADLIEAVHAIDKAPRLVILDSLQAQPLQGTGTLAIGMKLYAFLQEKNPPPAPEGSL